MKLLSHSIILELRGFLKAGEPVRFANPGPLGTTLGIDPQKWADMGYPLEVKVTVEPASRAPII